MSKRHIILNLSSMKFCVYSFYRDRFVGSILMDLSKAYDCLPHDLLLAKLQAYGFSKESTRLFLSYLTNRTQRVKIGSTFNHWTNI